MLEVIALDARDAVAAQAGGADRIELVGTMAAGGLSATPAQIREIRAHSDLPIRAMLRAQAGYAAGDAHALADQGAALIEAGADALVLGFLRGTPAQLDTEIIAAIAQQAKAPEITIHRAIDSAADYQAAWRRILALTASFSGVTSVLTAGAATGVTAGLANLRTALALPGVNQLMLVGGGLQPEHLPALQAAGVRKFHVGSPVRRDWESPVDPELVKRWVALTAIS